MGIKPHPNKKESIMPEPDPIPQGKTREEIQEFNEVTAEAVMDMLSDILNKCNDIFEKVNE